MKLENTKKVLVNSIFRVGKVVSVQGRQVRIEVDKLKNSPHLLFNGSILKNISVGGYLKIIKGFVKIIVKVEGEYISKDSIPSMKGYSRSTENINRVLNVSLIGFFDGNRFKRGIRELPLIDNTCYLVNEKEFNVIHNLVNQEDEPLNIGTLAIENAQPISIGVDSLFARHIGIFGNTGSGKSYTLAKIYNELYKNFQEKDKFFEKSKFFLIDFNGEYVGENAIIKKDYKKIYKLSTRASGDKFPIKKKDLEDPSFWSIILDATEKMQKPFLKRALTSTNFENRLSSEDGRKEITKEIIRGILLQNNRKLEKGIIRNFLYDIEILFDERSIKQLISDYQSNLNWHSQAEKYYYSTGSSDIYANDATFEQVVINNKIQSLNSIPGDLDFLKKIKMKIILKYYSEIISGYSIQEHIVGLIKRLDKKITDLTKVIEVKVESGDNPSVDKANFVVVSLKDVNIEMRKILPLIFCKQLYDQKKVTDNKETFLNIIIDEAHNILSHSSQRESSMWKDYRLETFEEIIKEGRKFGVFLTLASQRPFDISSTIISQLHNFFLHRLINNKDIEAVEKSISYLDKVSFEYLPILPTGTCILAGLLTEMPLIIEINELEKQYEPNSKTISLVSNWN